MFLDSFSWLNVIREINVNMGKQRNGENYERKRHNTRSREGERERKSERKEPGRAQEMLKTFRSSLLRMRKQALFQQNKTTL